MEPDIKPPDIKIGEDIFDCIQCGECCKGFGGTYVTDRDIIRIAAYIDCPPEYFVKKYCENSGSKLVLACGSDGRCIFFDRKRQCTIHPVKPYMCRAWPFIRPVLRYPENWNIMAGSCSGIKKDIEEDLLLKIIKAEIEKLDECWEGLNNLPG
jgi:Fe-S-cluster containining protein